MAKDEVLRRLTPPHPLCRLRSTSAGVRSLYRSAALQKRGGRLHVCVTPERQTHLFSIHSLQRPNLAVHTRPVLCCKVVVCRKVISASACRVLFRNGRYIERIVGHGNRGVSKSLDGWWWFEETQLGAHTCGRWPRRYGYSVRASGGSGQQSSATFRSRIAPSSAIHAAPSPQEYTPIMTCTYIDAIYHLTSECIQVATRDVTTVIHHYFEMIYRLPDLQCGASGDQE
ncbi:hypothetical protein C8Q74DRAFT_842406 [Fomes fomentarius]|nr:hypothetical protein C8Q74DRAFT_842406 [Fomes fomentarius]